MSHQKPSVGRIVHYVSHGTPVRQDGSQAYTSECRAAIITEVKYLGNLSGPPVVGLAVLNPEGMFFNRGVSFHDGGETPGNPACPNHPHSEMPFRYCGIPGCGWVEASHLGGTWHWPEQV